MRQVIILTEAIGQVLANAQPITQIEHGVGTNLITFVVRLNHGTLLIEVVSTHDILSLLRTARECSLVILDDTDLANLIPPIGVGNWRINIGADLIVYRLNIRATTCTCHSHVVRFMVQPRVSAGTKLQMARQIGIPRQIQTILRSLPLSLNQVVTAQQAISVPRLGHTHIAIVGQLRLAATRTLLRSDQDDTVGSLCTIDSCRGGILQHLHTLNVVRVQGA